MSDTAGAHQDLHSEQGARSGEHPGRSPNPVIKVRDIAWLEFEKPDLVRAEAFAQAFGFSTATATSEDELQLRGTDRRCPVPDRARGARGRDSPAWRSPHSDEVDVLRLAERRGHRLGPCPRASADSRSTSSTRAGSRCTSSPAPTTWPRSRRRPRRC